MEKINLTIETKSNLFIGGMPKRFEIGGVDMETVTDYKGQPIIPASSLKGMLRKIAKEMEGKDEKAKQIGEAYKKYLGKLQAEHKELRASRFHSEIAKASVESLFGIQGFNDTPKLIFKDLELKEEVAKWYSIDSKNKIEMNKKQIGANPRTYKTVRPGLVFRGEIILYRMEVLPVKGIKEFIKRALTQFNGGVYRLGNSKSRGYGYVEVHFDEE